MQKTALNYLQDSYQFLARARVIKVGKDEQGRDYLILDQTIFYPQGGGQPYDTGKITGSSGALTVTDVRLIDEQVYHYGVFTSNPIQTGEEVNLEVDELRRRLNSKNHSAGHLLDTVFYDLNGTLRPIKGFHFPDGPYVEYFGVLNEDPEVFAKKLEEKINECISNGFEVKTEILSNKEGLKQRCNFVPDYIPDNKPIRVVTLYGDKGTPCGGTHVKDIKEIGSVRITKIKNKDGNTRISYLLTQL